MPIHTIRSKAHKHSLSIKLDKFLIIIAGYLPADDGMAWDQTAVIVDI